MAISRGKAERQAARAARLAAALRENLKRRKLQARSRAQSPGEEKTTAGADSPVKTPDPDFRRNQGRD